MIHFSKAGPCGSYARYSSDLQRDDRIADQQRKCRERAAANGDEIAPHLEFSDEAISGTKLHRNGLDAMLSAAEKGELRVLYIHSLSRLSRESVITLPLLKKLVYNLQVRVISVTEGIDTDATGWELIAHIMSIVHEQYVKDLAANVLRGQEGTVLAGYSVGDWCFGYGWVPIADSEAHQRSRNVKPRKMCVIAPDEAAWVQRIFQWFVHERRALRWIERELNRLGAPKDHRATTKHWRHQQVRGVLRNEKYIGRWAWGKRRNVRDPLTGKVRQVDRASAESDQWTRPLSHLRIIDDQTFQAAQRLLDENRQRVANHRRGNGQLNGSVRESGGQRTSHLLSQLVECGHCGRMFHVGGAHGKYLFCPGYQQGMCDCRTQLPRGRAEQLILAEIGARILLDAAWRQETLNHTLRAWRSAATAIPTELATARRRLADIDQRITRLVDQVEERRGGAELDERLAQRRREKQELTRTVQNLENADRDRGPEPSAAWVDARLCDLSSVLAGGTPAAAHALRGLLDGNLVVNEIRRSDRQRHFLRGRFKIHIESLSAVLSGDSATVQTETVVAADFATEEIVIDFREPAAIEPLSEQAKQLYDQGLMHAEIAERLGCARSRITAALKHWHASRGLVMPDGRSRRSTLVKKHLDPPLCQRIAGRVMELYDAQMLLQDIASSLGVDRNTVTAAIQWWHASQGLPIPDGRTRRKSLPGRPAA